MEEKGFSGSLFSLTHSLSFSEHGKLLKSNIRDGLLCFSREINYENKSPHWLDAEMPVGQNRGRQAAALALVERVKIIQEGKIRKGIQQQ